MDGRNELLHNKAELRKRLLSVRRDLADKPVLSRTACVKAARLVRGNVMVYVSIGSELDTKPLIEILERNGTDVFVPYTSSDGIITPMRLIKIGTPDRMGNLPSECLERVDKKIKMDYCVTPLLGFNPNGNRIGYGKGCYDRFFGKNETYKIGLAFSCQLVNFRAQPHDVPLDCCVTEQDVIYFIHASDCGKI